MAHLNTVPSEGGAVSVRYGDRRAGRGRGSELEVDPQKQTGQRLRLLSYNIQAGIASGRYRHYVTHCWKHVFPYAERQHNLFRIAHVLRAFDLVGLQEADSGSLRTGFINQTEFLAEEAGFPFWYYQSNRRVGRVTQHGNGLLARFRPHELIEHKLPGLPGRGAFVARFGSRETGIALFIMHLALSKRSRLRQMNYLGELINEYPHAILMGDLNCGLQSREMHHLFRSTRLQTPSTVHHTFPSWRPTRNIDHILVTPGIEIEHTYIPEWLYSDHLPVAMEVVLPEGVAI